MSQPLSTTQASSDATSNLGNLQSVGPNQNLGMATGLQNSSTGSAMQNQIPSQQSQYSTQSVKSSQIQSSASGTCNEFSQVIFF